MKPRFPRLLLVAVAFLYLTNSSCHNKGREEHPSEETALFTLLSPEKTHIDFQNTLTEGLNTNVLMYEYFYNGGGVAVGDINNDGLDDIYFTGNMTDNKLYLNKGHLQFQDVTGQAGVAGRPGPWKTGVTLVDINGDGNLDMYVCYSGNVRGEKRENQLFINEGADPNGIPHFSEQAQQYGLADSAHSTQAAFFDYDRDGDLDMLLLNHNIKRYTNLDAQAIEAFKQKTDLMSGVRLFQNNRGHFEEITLAAGLKSTVLSHGLGAGVGDLNCDGWPDIYLSNDYAEPDYLYLNNRNKTFTNALQAAVGHTSFYSMGNDIADINNDGLPDFMTLDMLPEDNYRQKLLAAPDNYESFQLLVNAGFHYQYMRNMLQLNNGNGTFSEIGQLAGVSNTDWSWAPLFADFDNDGWKDLFVSNGYVRDYTNMDFLKYIGDFLQNRSVMRTDLLALVQKMPASNVVNYVFHNNGDLTFRNTSRQWGFTLPSNSNGAAYADLDNDGDLDLVINNINQPAFVYENTTSGRTPNNYLEIRLHGSGQNTQGLGARVTTYSNGKQQLLEQMPTRGFQSSVSPTLHFGTGAEKTIDSLRVVWSDGHAQVLYQVKCNQRLTLEQAQATAMPMQAVPVQATFTETQSPINRTYAGTAINDFKRQPLLINPLSFSGPCLVKGDVNGDGLEDVYTGGDGNQPGALYIQQRKGGFVKQTSPVFETDKLRVDADACFFDANRDGFTDLYVASGGYHNYAPDDSLLQDRLYLNNGKGTFSKAHDALPQLRVSKSCVRVADVNGDGYPDLFVGGRVVPGRYPETPSSYILVNDGKGHFSDATANVAPSLQKAGMITDAAWLDLNGDHKQDLIVVGEWMPVTLYLNQDGKLVDKTSEYLDKSYRGWWNKLQVGDFNQDGKPDLVIGNEGLNTQCKASERQPAELYYKDFDDNGSIDPIFCFYIKDTSYPYVFRDELLDQVSSLRTKFPDYKSYASATLKDIFTEDERKGAQHFSANCLRTVYLESGPDGKLHEKALPIEVQVSPVFTILGWDYDQDGDQDLLLCGNINQARLRFGKYDANEGILLQNNGKGDFRYIPQPQSGFHLSGDVRSALQINHTLLFGINQGTIKAYTKKPQ